MKHLFKNLGRFSAVLAAVCMGGTALSAQQPNPRSAVATNVSAQRAGGRVISRGDGKNATVVNNSARTTAARNGKVAARASVSTPIVRSTARSAVSARSGTPAARVASNNLARVIKNASPRSATSSTSFGASRAAAVSRATAVFNDVSKIGGGYAACRDSYATCMDQLCANANDTYRRCFCSDRFIDFRDTEYALDEAKSLLMQFEDNNLNAVDKTAAEVSAMYSATVGEAAIKKDTSGAQSILNQIGDLLSGKKKSSSKSSSTSLGVMSLDFSSDIGDIWGGGGDGTSNSIFDTSTGVDLTSLEGQALYEAANKQCLQLAADQCDSKAVLNMATSSYGILISQDCNAYEKNINAKREAVKQTVRQAEKILREARLEEYRAHNSADVNECVEKVRAVMTTDVACGANYKRCLDPSGKYTSQSTGEPIYSSELFKLQDTIKLSDSDSAGSADFDKFLDSKKMFAKTALDTCRDNEKAVWEEFKRVAIIEIAQAQDEKIEEVRTSCVSVMAQCYDAQSNALKSFDAATAQTAGALSAYAAKEMCRDKVSACASLYGSSADNQGCTFDDYGRITADSYNSCGLKSLLAFVDTVDNTRVAESCEVAVENYINELCTPSNGTIGFPWNCRGKRIMSDTTKYTSNDDIMTKDTESVQGLVMAFAYENCKNPTVSEYDEEQNLKNDRYDTLLTQTIRAKVNALVENIQDELEHQLMEQCDKFGGYWVLEDDTTGKYEEMQAFTVSVYGRNNNNDDSIGKCVQKTDEVICQSYNSDDAEVVLARYTETPNGRGDCLVSEQWYRNQCALLGSGYYDNNTCYVETTSANLVSNVGLDKSGYFKKDLDLDKKIDNKFDIDDKGNTDVKNPPAPSPSPLDGNAGVGNGDGGEVNPPAPSPSIPDGNAGAGNGGGGQVTEDPTIHLEPGAKFNKHQEELALF